jgi:CubicO group peptidase (beta-lactamase class C family)
MKTFVTAVSAMLALTVSANTGAASAAWDTQRLDKAFALARTMGTTTLMVVTGGKVVRSHGDITKPHDIHSVRKAVLSALVGLHAGPGARQINLASTLEELGIDERPVPLTALQKTATVRDLIRSVSGINRPAAAESVGGVNLLAAEKNDRLGAKSNRPGTVWAYNNWDYNALTTVLEQRTGRSVHEIFKTGIADPLQMDDVSPASVYSLKDEKQSIHAKVGFRLSARDMAKFGQLYLNNGMWQGRQLIPAEWIARVTTDYSKTGRRGFRSCHGYLWWVPCDGYSEDLGIPQGTYLATGFAGQRIVVIPALNTVIVHQVSTDDYGGICLPWIEKRGLTLDQALAHARGECRKPGHADDVFCRACRFFSDVDFERVLSAILAAHTGRP